MMSIDWPGKGPLPFNESHENKSNLQLTGGYFPLEFCSTIEVRIFYCYYMSKKSRPNLYNNLLYKMG